MIPPFSALLAVSCAFGISALAVPALAQKPEVPVAASASAATTISDDILKIRDPFKRPASGNGKREAKSELELFPVDQFKMVGVLTGPIKLRAMVLAPNGKTYFVSENQKIGVRNGTVRKITSESILVREKIVNVVGREEDIDFEIRLPSERKSPAEKSTGG